MTAMLKSHVSFLVLVAVVLQAVLTFRLANGEEEKKRMLDSVANSLFDKRRMLDHVGSSLFKRRMLDHVGSSLFDKRRMLDHVGSSLLDKRANLHDSRLDEDQEVPETEVAENPNYQNGESFQYEDAGMNGPVVMSGETGFDEASRQLDEGREVHDQRPRQIGEFLNINQHSQKLNRAGK